MASGTFARVDVLCPFYRCDKARRSISCEGFLDKSSIQILFVRNKEFQFHFATYCCKNYKMCEVYRMIMDSKYPDD